jgi:hypothetical protein
MATSSVLIRAGMGGTPWANELGAGRSGTNHYYDTGTFSIDVNSECSWSDEAVTIPR